MTTECTIFAVCEANRAPARAEAGTSSALLEALGRALGYTERELATAGKVLNGFEWQVPAGSPRGLRLAASEGDDPGPDRKWVA